MAMVQPLETVSVAAWAWPAPKVSKVASPAKKVINPRRCLCFVSFVIVNISISI